MALLRGPDSDIESAKESKKHQEKRHENKVRVESKKSKEGSSLRKKEEDCLYQIHTFLYFSQAESNVFSLGALGTSERGTGTQDWISACCKKET